MNPSQDIPWINMFALSGLLIIPLVVFHRLKISLSKDLVYAVLRMSVQLLLIGVYLQFLFEYNNIFLTLLWAMVMILVASYFSLEKSGLNMRLLLRQTILAIMISNLTILVFALLFIVKAEPFYEARYVIPLLGMVLGNTLRTNVIALERFYSEVRKYHEEQVLALVRGEDLLTSVNPYFKVAIEASIQPTIATMTTLGIVSLPGMMTGQILGGTYPFIAVKYQIVISILIFVTMTLASFLCIRFSLKNAFSSYGLLKSELFKAK